MPLPRYVAQLRGELEITFTEWWMKYRAHVPKDAFEELRDDVLTIIVGNDP